MHIKVGDEVVVLSGFHRGERGKVLTILRDEGKVIVEKINLVFKHVRPSQKNPRGGRLSKEMPIDISNVMLVCAGCSRPSRTGIRYAEDGSKERYCKACETGTVTISPPRKRYAGQTSS